MESIFWGEAVCGTAFALNPRMLGTSDTDLSHEGLECYRGEMNQPIDDRLKLAF